MNYDFKKMNYLDKTKIILRLNGFKCAIGYRTKDFKSVDIINADKKTIKTVSGRNYKDCYIRALEFLAYI